MSMRTDRLELTVLGAGDGKRRQCPCAGRCRRKCRCPCRCRRRRAAVEALEGRVLLSTITGTVFSDLNSNGVQDPGENGIAGVTVFLDANNDGILQPGETTTTTAADGSYSFTVNDAPNRTFVVSQVLPPGYQQVAPVGNAVASENVNISRTTGNQAEQAIAIDPTNPNRVFMVSNATGNFLQGAFSTDGGLTWTRRNMATGSDGLAAACCDPSLAWDAFGNLFLVYLISGASQAIVARSTNGGQSFTQIATLGSSNVDQPTVAVGPGAGGVGGSVWVLYNQPINNGTTDQLRLAGATVSGLGNTGSFTAATVPSGNGSYGDVAVGPSGQVMIVYQQTGTNQGPSQVYMNVDPDGLGGAGLGGRVTLLTTNVGDFDFIPAQSRRSIDAEVGLAWDRSGGPHNGRVYLLYTDELPDESNNTDVFVKFSDDNGATWSAPVRVNDDATTRSQFLPRIALDQTSGNVAVSWHDCRNDDGLHGPGDTNGIPNDDAQFWGTVSTDGGASFLPNLQISAGTSNAAAANSVIDYGDYTGLAFQGGVFMPAWADNSNSTLDNPSGTLSRFDVYTARVTVLPPGAAGRYSVVAGSTQGAAGLNFADHALAATVTGRFVFYNGSAFDGNDESANSADDGAIATDKTALLPGQTASFANYTSYFHGINGIMIDVAGLANPTGLSAADFSFAAGAGTDPSTFVDAAAPAVSVRSGAGAGGSDRITLIWPDNVIQNEWLRVTVNANGNTGLASPDVFYFGNLIGEANGNGLVTVADIALTKSLSGQAASITSPADFNRNGQISVADIAIAKAYQAGMLSMISAPAVPAPVFSTVPMSAASVVDDRPVREARPLHSPPPQYLGRGWTFGHLTSARRKRLRRPVWT
jgi:hypothetical protein